MGCLILSLYRIIVQFPLLFYILEQNSCFHNISAPGITELLGSDGTQQKYFSASRREEELNSELVTLLIGHDD